MTDPTDRPAGDAADPPAGGPADPTDPAAPMPDSDVPQRFPGHPRLAETFSQEEPRRVMLMTPYMVGIGGLLAFFLVVGLVVVLPTATYTPPPSDNWLPLSDQAAAGRKLYLANGCVYCHSGFSRPQDVAQARYYLYPRESEPGDFNGEDQSPNIMGTERTGPDLSQEGGMHPDEWQVAHYTNPRFTMPLSIMPSFRFWSEQEMTQAIAFNQAQGGKEGVLRYATVSVGNALMDLNSGAKQLPNAFSPAVYDVVRDLPGLQPSGTPEDMSPWGMGWGPVWMINSFERGYWLTDNPLPLTQQNLMRGKQVYLARCAGCHGSRGGGDGPGATFLTPKPFEFRADSGPMSINGPFASEGMMYHRILTAGPGTAMESFGTRLSVDDIWRTVLFLRTIAQGGLDEPVPTEAMYDDYEAPPALLRYIEDHPLTEPGTGFTQDPDESVFLTGARWLAPGLAPDDEVLVAGQIPMTLERLAGLIRVRYEELVTEAYEDAVARGDDLPPREQIFSTERVEFAMPS